MESFVIPVIFGFVMFLLGFIAGRLSKSYKKIGRFVINDGDPKKSAFWLELDHDLDVIERQKVIGLQVLIHSFPPTKDNS